MALDRIRTVGKVTGAAATTAPYVRRLATDDDLREDATEFIRSANNLITHVRSDRQLRRDLGKMISTMQSGAGHLRSDVRPRHHYVRNFVIGTGLFVMGIGAAIVVGWPRARNRVRSAVDQTTSRATDTVQDMREKIASGEENVRAA
jgi:hypothetical protein